MAVSSFVATVWDAELQLALEKEKVSENFVNHNYEGEVMQAGSVKINNLTAVTLSDYDGTDITYTDPTTSDVTLQINRDKYFAVPVDDVDKAQVRGDLRGPIIASGAEQIGNDLDNANFAEMISGAATANKIGIGVGATPVEVTTAAQAKALLLRMKKVADKNNVPREGRVFVADYDFESLILGDSDINVSPAKSDESLNKGYIGTLYGIKLYSSNNLPGVTGEDAQGYCILTHPAMTTEAVQINELEALRLQNAFADGIRGLCVSGRKVTRPEGVVVAQVSYEALGD